MTIKYLPTAEFLPFFDLQDLDAESDTKFDQVDLTNIIEEVEADLDGLLAALGITVDTDDSPISVKILKNIIRYGTAYQAIQAAFPGATGQIERIEVYFRMWTKLKNDLKSTPGILSDATFGTPAGLGADRSAFIKNSMVDDDNYEAKFTMEMDL